MTHAEQDQEDAEQPLLFSIVMPAYNEEDTVEKTLGTLSDHLDAQGFRFEILVVNDGSADNTGAVINQAAQSNPRIKRIDNEGPNGFGFAIRRGLDAYSGDAVAIVMADGSDAPKDVAAYFTSINEGFDCAFGSRFAKGAEIKGYPPVKLFLNRIANRFISMLVGKPYNDFTNGFKCYRREVIDDMQPLISGQFNITIELAVKAVRGGWRYSVTPNDWSQRDAGASSFKILKLARPYGATLIYCLLEDYLKRIRR